MYVFLAYLQEDRPGFGQQVPGNREPVAQVGQVAMNPVAPRVTERLDLFGLARDVGCVA
jgi:hypothetical protein